MAGKGRLNAETGWGCVNKPNWKLQFAQTAMMMTIIIIIKVS